MLTIVQATSPMLSLLQQEHDELLDSFTNSRPETNLYEEFVSPNKVLELDLHVKPVGNVSGALALLVDGKLKSKIVNMSLLIR